MNILTRGTDVILSSLAIVRRMVSLISGVIVVLPASRAGWYPLFIYGGTIVVIEIIVLLGVGFGKRLAFIVWAVYSCLGLACAPLSAIPATRTGHRIMFSWWSIAEDLVFAVYCIARLKTWQKPTSEPPRAASPN